MEEKNVELSWVWKVGAVLLVGMFFMSFILIVMGNIATWLYFPNAEKIELWNNSIFLVKNHPYVIIPILALLYLFLNIALFKKRNTRI